MLREYVSGFITVPFHIFYFMKKETKEGTLMNSKTNVQITGTETRVLDGHEMDKTTRKIAHQ